MGLLQGLIIKKEERGDPVNTLSHVYFLDVRSAARRMVVEYRVTEGAPPN